MEFREKDAQEVFEHFTQARGVLQGYTVSVEPEPARVDPLMLIRVFNSERTTMDLYPLAEAFCRDRSVKITDNDGKIVKSFIFSGTGKLSTVFETEPYYLDLIISFTYAELLKKLTPPLTDTQKANEQSV